MLVCQRTETTVNEIEHQRIPRLKTSETWPHLLLFPTLGNVSFKAYHGPNTRPCVYGYCPAGFSQQVYKIGTKSTYLQPIQKLRMREVDLALSKVKASKYHFIGQFPAYVFLVSKSVLLTTDCYCLPTVLIPKKGALMILTRPRKQPSTEWAAWPPKAMLFPGTFPICI